LPINCDQHLVHTFHGVDNLSGVLCSVLTRRIYPERCDSISLPSKYIAVCSISDAGTQKRTTFKRSLPDARVVRDSRHPRLAWSDMGAGKPLRSTLISWPAVLEKCVPCIDDDAAHLMIGQFATTQLVCQHFAESSSRARWDQSN